MSQPRIPGSSDMGELCVARVDNSQSLLTPGRCPRRACDTFSPAALICFAHLVQLVDPRAVRLAKEPRMQSRHSRVLGNRDELVKRQWSFDEVFATRSPPGSTRQRQFIGAVARAPDRQWLRQSQCQPRTADDPESPYSSPYLPKWEGRRSLKVICPANLKKRGQNHGRFLPVRAECLIENCPPPRLNKF